MNGKKKKSKKLVLDSGKVNHFLQVSLTSNHFHLNRFYFKNLIFIISHFLKDKLKRNESQKEDSFQIYH